MSTAADISVFQRRCVGELMSKDSKIFRPIQGMRAVLNFWVCACHSIVLLTFLSGMSPDTKKFEAIMAAPWALFALGMGNQVDVFFVISGFLVSWQLLQSRPRNLTPLVSSFVIKRVLRLWPVMLFVVIMTYVMGDVNSQNMDVLLSFFTFPLGHHIHPFAYIMGWSNRVDIEACLVLITCIYLLSKINLLNFPVSVFLAAVSILPRLLRYVAMDGQLGYLSVPPSARKVPSFINEFRQEWLRDTYGLEENQVLISPNAQANFIFEQEYLITHQRWTPFFIGLCIALSLHHAIKVTPSAMSVLKRVGHALALFFSVFVVSIPLIMSLLVSLKSSSMPIDRKPTPPAMVNLIYSVFGRSLFALSAAYLLFRCLVPSSHPLHLAALTRFLSCDTFQFLGNMSYGVYMIHIRIAIELLWRWCPPAVMDAWFGPYNMLAKFLFALIVMYSVSCFLAWIVHMILEKPVARLTPMLLKICGLKENKDDRKRND